MDPFRPRPSNESSFGAGADGSFPQMSSDDHRFSRGGSPVLPRQAAAAATAMGVLEPDGQPPSEWGAPPPATSSGRDASYARGSYGSGGCAVLSGIESQPAHSLCQATLMRDIEPTHNQEISTFFDSRVAADVPL